MIGAAGAVPDQAGDFGLMHREDHRGGRTGAAERVAHVGYVENRRAVSAEGLRDLDAEQTLRARCIDGLLWEACATVDIVGFSCCGGGYACSPDQRRAEVRGRLAVG